MMSDYGHTFLSENGGDFTTRTSHFAVADDIEALAGKYENPAHD